MEVSIKRKVKISVHQYEDKPTNNDNDNNEEYKILNEKLTIIINKINENFDFKTYEKEKITRIEEVIINYIIIIILYSYP